MGTIEFAENIIREIIRIVLNDMEYGLLREADIHHLKYSQNADIYLLNNTFKSVNMKNSKGRKIAQYTIERISPQTVDPVPIIRNGQLIKLRPVIILPDACHSLEDKWVITHEICHLLSLGEYIYDSSEKVFEHYFGINQYVYDQNFNLISINQNDHMNEIINDAVTWHFLELINNCSIIPANEFIKHHCQRIRENTDLKLLIGYYFSGKIEKINQILKTDSLPIS